MFVDSAAYIGTFRVYCSNTSDYSSGETVIYKGEHLNEDIDGFFMCRYITYVPSPVNGISEIELCEIEIGGRLNDFEPINATMFYEFLFLVNWKSFLIFRR